MSIYTRTTKRIRYINLSFLLIIAALLGGCASGAGTNNNKYFNNALIIPRVVSIQVSEDASSIITGPTLEGNADNFIASLALGGIAGAYFSTNTGWSAIRGTYDASMAFNETINQISSSDVEPVVILKLGRFEYGIRPAKGFKSGGILSFLEISSQLKNSPNKVWSAYACDLQIKGTFFPNDEKNMLREMMEVSLSHWAQLINSPANLEKLKVSAFPQKLKGDIVGDEAKCVFEAFVPDQERTLKTTNLSEKK